MYKSVIKIENMNIKTALDEKKLINNIKNKLKIKKGINRE